MKILFSCPIIDIQYQWFMGFLQVQEQLKKYETEFFFPYRQPINTANEAMAERALEGSFDYLLRMDDDIWDVPDDALEKLLIADKEFISCVSYASGFPYQRCAFRKANPLASLIEIGQAQAGGLKETGGQGVKEVDMSAFPFTLIKTSVFKKIKPPWFNHTLTVPLDNFFCQALLDNGIQPYVHMDLQVTHRGIAYWNRWHRFISDAEFMISTGQFGPLHPQWNLYLDAKDKFASIYGNRESALILV